MLIHGVHEYRFEDIDHHVVYDLLVSVRNDYRSFLPLDAVINLDGFMIAISEVLCDGLYLRDVLLLVRIHLFESVLYFLAFVTKGGLANSLPDVFV